MEKVAEHINEMQRIHEEYGAIFDHLFRQHQKSCKQVSLILIFTYSKKNFKNKNRSFISTFVIFFFLNISSYILQFTCK